MFGKISVFSAAALFLTACSHHEMPKNTANHDTFERASAHLVVLDKSRSDDMAVYETEQGSYLWFPQPLSDFGIDVVFLHDGERLTFGRPSAGGFVQGSRFTVLFDTDSARLSPQAMAVLDHAAAFYRQSGVRIRGFADPRHTRSHNLSLSRRRADAVARYLAGAGVPIAFKQGFGECCQQATYEQSRRVEVEGR